MPKELIVTNNAILTIVQDGLKKAMKKAAPQPGAGVELAALADELRKCEKAINTQPAALITAGSPTLTEAEQMLVTAFNGAVENNDNAAIAALSKQIRKYEKTLSKPAAKPAPQQTP